MKGSYGLAVQFADEREKEAREYKQRHPSKKGLSLFLEAELRAQAFQSGVPCYGMWNAGDVAKKACEILRERLAE